MWFPQNFYWPGIRIVHIRINVTPAAQVSYFGSGPGLSLNPDWRQLFQNSGIYIHVHFTYLVEHAPCNAMDTKKANQQKVRGKKRFFFSSLWYNHFATIYGGFLFPFLPAMSVSPCGLCNTWAIARCHANTQVNTRSRGENSATGAGGFVHVHSGPRVIRTGQFLLFVPVKCRLI